VIGTKKTNGAAVKRKGKVCVINNNIFGLGENSISQYHRELLNDSKKANEIKTSIKKEMEDRKRYIIEMILYGRDFDEKELKILGIKKLSKINN
jgi:hypothetical protein